MNEIYEVWVVIDTQPKHIDESVVAIFTDENKLLQFSQNASYFFNTGRFVIQSKVSVDPNSDITVSIR